jgi:hypothetical protein
VDLDHPRCRPHAAPLDAAGAGLVKPISTAYGPERRRLAPGPAVGLHHHWTTRPVLPRIGSLCRDNRWPWGTSN